MPLNKSVCLQCVQKVANDKNNHVAPVSQDWINKNFDEIWSQGRTFCFLEGYEIRQLDLTDGPPEDCPYLLEHIIS